MFCGGRKEFEGPGGQTCGETLNRNVGIQRYARFSWQAQYKSQNRNVGRAQKKEYIFYILAQLQRYDFHFFVKLSPKTDRNVGFQRYEFDFCVRSPSILAPPAFLGNWKTHCNWLSHVRALMPQVFTFRGRRSIW